MNWLLMCLLNLNNKMSCQLLIAGYYVLLNLETHPIAAMIEIVILFIIFCYTRSIVLIVDIYIISLKVV